MAIKEIFTVEEANAYLELGLLWFAWRDGSKWNSGQQWAPLRTTYARWTERDFRTYRCGIQLEE